MKRIVLSKEQIDHIKENNFNSTQIKNYLNVSYPTANKLCKFYGITPSNDNRTYRPNDDYFKTWSNEMAFFLGLIAADGHIRKQNSCISISLQEKDKQIVENLKKAVEYDGKLYHMNKKKGKKQWCLSMTSKEMASDLNKLGLSNNKTFDLEWINNMPDQYVSHFVRGYFDGDGSSYINEEKANYTANLAGTYKLTKNIKDYYNKSNNNNFGALQPKKKIQYLVFNGRYNALHFLNWIYTDSTPETRLERKYELYLKLKNTICAEEQTPNNSLINQYTADDMRRAYANGKTVKQIALESNQSESLVYDVIANRSWRDASYSHERKKQDTIFITYQGRTLSIKEWHEETGIPYQTIDRRWRQGLPVEQIFHTGEKRLNLGKAKSDKDKAAHELAFNLRTDYKNGLIGKSLYEKYGVPKSRAMDILLNRTCKEDNIWWK